MTTGTPVNFDLIADISEIEIERVEALVGTPIRVEQWNHEASWDSVKHYSWGLGDDNPLYCDPDYAEATPYGILIAPPTFPFTAFDGAIGAGMPGVQPVYAGTEWTFHRRLRRGDRLVASADFGPVVRKSGRNAADMVIQSALCRYVNQAGDLVAESVARTFRLPRRAATSGLAFEARDEEVWTDAQLDDIRAEAVAEYRRGSDAVPDFAVGDAVPMVVKGPIGKIDMTAYYAGCPGSPGYKSVELAWKYREWARTQPGRLPSNYDPSYFSERVLPSIGHQDAAAARELGMPGAYNNGPQRVGWFAHCISNWMGDSAFLSRLDVRLNLPEIFGDVVRIGGTVTAVNGSTVTVELVATNHLRERTAKASAEVVFDDYGRA